ncbi:carbohydrate-binding protein [Micromonosporaceae bacterium Da 78-11]
MVAGAGLAAAVWLPTRHDVASAAETPAVFADEFDGARGTGLDPDKWLLDQNTTGGLDRTRSRSQDTGGAVLDGEGNLVVTRLLISKVAFAQAYGHAEARIEVSRAAGPWRAFAVLDPSGRVLAGRFDALEQGVDPTSGDDFHTYAIDWTPESIVWSVDGRPSLRLVPNVAARPLFLVLNLATDGISPARMVVDHVRVSTGDSPAPTATASALPTATSASPTLPPTVKPTTKPTVKPTTKPPATVKPSATRKAPTVPAWKAYTKYAVGARVTYKGVTYKVKQAHTSLPGWEPTALPELFEKV